MEQKWDWPMIVETVVQRVGLERCPRQGCVQKEQGWRRILIAISPRGFMGVHGAGRQVDQMTKEEREETIDLLVTSLAGFRGLTFCNFERCGIGHDSFRQSRIEFEVVLHLPQGYWGPHGFVQGPQGFQGAIVPAARGFFQGLQGFQGAIFPAAKI